MAKHGISLLLVHLLLIARSVMYCQGCGQGCADIGEPSFEERAQALMAQMTLEEKVSQLNTDSPAIKRLNISAFNWWQECLHGAKDVRVYHRGATLFPQPLALAATFDTDLMHRVATAIGDELRAKDNMQFGASGRHLGTNCFGPNINIYRDPRWGRGSETYGEDPFLTGEMSKFFVGALQGNHSRYLKVGATCKHFAAYSLEEWEGVSRLAFDAKLDPLDIHDTYLPAFRACVSEARGASVMCSYNAINGVPACANDWLLGEQLRGKMGFQGLVVSDCGALDNIGSPYQHAFTNSSAAAMAAALRAGTDLSCLDYSGLLEAVAQGLVQEAQVERAVKRVLLVRFRMGHFDLPEANPYSRIPASAVGHPRHLALAREASAKSIVLLKNEIDKGTGKPVLPLDLSSMRKKVMVIGPMANYSEYLLGNCYGQPWGEIVTPLQAIEEGVLAHKLLRALDEELEVQYLLGADVMGTYAEVEDTVSSCDTADVCIFMVGTTMLQGDRQMRERSGSYPLVATSVEDETQDRRSLLLPGRQLDIIQAAAKRIRNTPLVVVLIHGGPLDVEWLQTSPKVGAIMTAWFPGQGAAAIADVLFGKVSPSGRLPMTFYFENYTQQAHMMSMHMRPWPGRTHRFLQVPALYPFGHGLSFTTFAYSNLSVHHVEGAKTREGQGTGQGYVGNLEVTVDVRNVGGLAAEEVVLLFVSYKGGQGVEGLEELAQHRRALWQREHAQQALVVGPCAAPGSSAGGWAVGAGAGASAPMQTLAGFSRVNLAPGEATHVSLTLSQEQFEAASSGAAGSAACVACGLYEVRVGGLATKVLLVGSAAV